MSKRARRIAYVSVPVAAAALVAALYFSGAISGCALPQTQIVTKQLYAGPETAVAPAEDWPRWRGPRGDQISRETGLLETWPEDGPRRLWAADVGLGYASPVAHRGRVYLFSMNDSKDTLTAFDAATGRILWSVAGAEGWTGSYPGTRATPTIDAERVYTYGGQGELLCRNLADGSTAWGVNVLEVASAKPLAWGQASTPLVDDTRVYVQAGKGGPIAVAFDKSTGAVAWKSEAAGIAGYAQPALADVAGTPQLIVFGGDQVYGMDPQTGRTLWQREWKTSYDVNASTPLYDPATRRLFLTSAYEHGSIQLELSPGGATPTWETPHLESRFQGAILDRGVLYANNEGKLCALDWLTGAVKWTADNSDLRLGIGGSLLRVDGDKLLTLSDRGMLGLVRATPGGARGIARAEVIDSREVWATPLLYAGRAYVKGQTEFVCLDLRGK